VDSVSIEKRLGARSLIPSRPEVEVHHRRRTALRTRTDRTTAQLVQVSITGALLVTAASMPGLEVGHTVDLVVQGRHSTVVVRRIDEHHDMTLYGVEYVTIDAWLEALVDRSVQAGRGDLVAAWNRATRS
jgi:PilZ domain-containing protein